MEHPYKKYGSSPIHYENSKANYNQNDKQRDLKLRLSLISDIFNQKIYNSPKQSSIGKMSATPNGVAQINYNMPPKKRTSTLNQSTDDVSISQDLSKNYPLTPIMTSKKTFEFGGRKKSEKIIDSDNSNLRKKLSLFANDIIGNNSKPSAQRSGKISQFSPEFYHATKDIRENFYSPTQFTQPSQPTPKRAKVRKYIKSYKLRTKTGRNEAGEKKINQDSVLELTNIYDNPNFNIFGVLDGHGSKGHIISSYAASCITKYFLKNAELLLSSSSDQDLYHAIIQDDYKIIRNCFTTTEKEVFLQYKHEATLSGTTCNLIIQIGRRILCANCGDSRSIAIKGRRGIIELSKDHKLTVSSEKERILKRGGEIHRLDDTKEDSDEDDSDNEGNPLRVWAPGEKFPGLAMSRSIGDSVATKIGVCCDCDITDYDLIDDGIKVCISATDGVWEFLSNEKVAKLANLSYNNEDIDEFCDSIIDKSQYAWKKRGNVIDDISLVTLFF